MLSKMLGKMQMLSRMQNTCQLRWQPPTPLRLPFNRHRLSRLSRLAQLARLSLARSPRWSFARSSQWSSTIGFTLRALACAESSWSYTTIRRLRTYITRQVQRFEARETPSSTMERSCRSFAGAKAKSQSGLGFTPATGRMATTPNAARTAPSKRARAMLRERS